MNVPFRTMRVSYTYNFRFIKLCPDFIEKMLSESCSILEKYGYSESFTIDDTDGFQPYIKLKRDVVSTSSHAIDWTNFTKKDKTVLKDLGEKLPKVKFKDKKLDGAEAFLSKSLSIDSTGSGSICISFLFPRSLCSTKLTLKDILSILNMADGAYVPKKNYEDVSSSERLSFSIENENTEEYNLWSFAANEINKFAYELKNICPNLKWLERDGDGSIVNSGILACRKFSVHEGEKAPIQNPYIYVELESDNFKNYYELIGRDHSECGANCLKNLLAQMLIRVGPTGTDKFGLNKDYLLREGVDPEHGYFASLYPIEYLHIWTHFRSTIAVLPPLNAPDSKDVVKAINRYLIAVRDSIREFRTRWHCLVTQHIYLDALTQHLKNSWDPNRPTLKEFWETQKYIVDRRFDMMKILETPIVCRRAASSLNHFYTELSKSYEIKDLKNDLIEKIRQINDLYQDCYSIRMSEEMLND